MLAFFLAMLLWNHVELFLRFNINSQLAFEIIGEVVPDILLAVALWLQLRIAFRQGGWTRLVVANAAAWGIVAYSVLTTYSFDFNFEPAPQFDATILPQAFLLRSMVSEDVFMDESQRLFVFPEESEEPDQLAEPAEHNLPEQSEAPHN